MCGGYTGCTAVTHQNNCVHTSHIYAPHTHHVCHLVCVCVGGSYAYMWGAPCAIAWDAWEVWAYATKTCMRGTPLHKSPPSSSSALIKRRPGINSYTTYSKKKTDEVHDTVRLRLVPVVAPLYFLNHQHSSSKASSITIRHPLASS